MTHPIIFWFRRDLRLADHPGFAAACDTGRPVIPVFIRDSLVESLGAAPKFRLELSLIEFMASLEKRNSRMILRSGDAQQVIGQLIRETGATSVWWSRSYDPDAIRRDSDLKTALKSRNIDARSFRGHLLFEPWEVQTRAGGFFKVYSPFWNAVRNRQVPAPVSDPTSLPTPERWPGGERLTDWALGAAMNRARTIVRSHTRAGERVAQQKLEVFLQEPVKRYHELRDRPDLAMTSELSDHLALGEIGPAQIWHMAQHALQAGQAGAEKFLKELVWREFAYHLMYHTPRILTENWKPDWDGFPWNRDEADPRVIAWKQGRTGLPFVDAAMRELYVTGHIHNRARMIAASYLTKHLMTHWQIGKRWFETCLTDWDPASNAMGWQWVAGSGPDAAPYFRVFNPETQAAKFDPDGRYCRQWIAEGQTDPPDTALDFFNAVPLSWKLSTGLPYPAPIVASAKGREIALNAYKNRGF